MEPRTIVIVMWRGLVKTVRNLPEGWTYEIKQHYQDEEDEEAKNNG